MACALVRLLGLLTKAGRYVAGSLASYTP